MNPTGAAVVASRARRGVRRAVLPALFAAILVGRDAGAAAALGVGRATWTPTVVATTVALAGYRQPRDSVYVFLRLTWSRRTARALRAQEDQGLRYTQEVRDISGQLSGTGFWVSDLPGAEYDRDDDDGDGRWDELEVTATDAAAIEPGRTYVVGFQLTRWSRACDDCRWRWSRRGADLEVRSQLSFWFGEWQASVSAGPYAIVEVPRMSRPRRPGPVGR